MQIDVYSAAGSKVKTLDLPATLFGASLNWGLMHQAVVRQQNNRRQSAAHVKTRGEVAGSTKKLFSQKHTGRARRGPVRSPVLRGGGKAFGPRNDRNFTTDMPKKMRHAALRSCLSLQASHKAIVGLESFPETIKTKTVADMLGKMPVELGRRILLITDGSHNALKLSARNLTNVKTVSAQYLNPEDVLNARHVIFMVDAIEAAEKLFGSSKTEAKLSKKAQETTEKKVSTKTTKKKPSAKKSSSASSSS